MKTKKVLALVVLAAMLISILPMAAFGVIDVSNSAVNPPSGTVSAQSAGAISSNDDGAEFTVTLVSDSNDWDVGINDQRALYIGTSRPASDHFYVKTGPNSWAYIGTYNENLKSLNNMDGVSADNLTVSYTANSEKALRIPFAYAAGFTAIGEEGRVREYTIKVISTASGRSQIAFGGVSASVDGAAGDPVTSYTFPGKNVLRYALSRAATEVTDIIQNTRYTAEFTAPKATKISLRAQNGVTTGEFANNVDSYTVIAYVETAGGVPVSGESVSFSISGGTGGRLSDTRATTNASGNAEVKLYSSRPGEVSVRARASGVSTASNEVDFTFNATGITSVKAEDDDGQKVARDAGTKWFRFSAFDANGNRMDFLKIVPDVAKITNLDRPVSTNKDAGAWTITGWMKGSGDGLTAAQLEGSPKMQAEIIAKPSGSSLDMANIVYSTHASGDGRFGIPYERLNKDGDYEVKVYLTNGVSVSYRFNVKDQGEVTAIRLSYGASSYSAGTTLPEPTVILADADGYELRRGYSHDSWGDSIALSISDASFMDGRMNPDGSFKLKDDKSGQVVMTVVDTDRNLVGTQTLEITKAASFLKLTPESVGAVGGEVNVKIELVDIDGKLAATGIIADPDKPASASIISKPEGSIVSASTVDTTNFDDGLASVKVSSNTEGDAVVQVIITEETMWEDDPDKEYGGRTYTGFTTVSFGATSGGGGQLIFIIGAPSFVTGTAPHAAESPAFIENGRTFFGVRDIATAIGATLEWDQPTQTATLAKNDIIVKVTVGADKIVVTRSGTTSEIPTDAAAINRNGRVYLPSRAMLEAFGYTVTFDPATQAIVCTL